MSVLRRFKELESILKKNEKMAPEIRYGLRRLASERDKKRKQLQVLEKDLGPQITSSIKNGKSRLSRQSIPRLSPIKESPTPSPPPSSSVFKFVTNAISSVRRSMKKGGNKRTRKYRRVA